jgi:diguanylate cyclase (GGDEF)-like protein
MKSIANRVGILVAAAMLVLLAADALVLQMVVLPGFEAMDALHAKEEMKRVQAEFENEQVLLDRFAADWAGWDDAYLFIQDHNSGFIEHNLETKVMFEQRLSLMWFVDLQGRTVWGRALNPFLASPVVHPSFPGPAIDPHSPLTGIKEPDIGVSSIMETPLGLMTVASRPIVTSHIQGPVRGYLIVGRLLDGRRLADIGGRLGVKLSGAAPLALGEFGKEAKALAGLVPGEIRLVDGEGSLDAFTTLIDVFGKPAILLRAEYPRQHLQLGRQTLGIALTILAASCFVLIGLCYLALRYYVSRPLASLVQDIKSMKTLSSEPSSLASGSGKGEVATVTREVKNMLERIAYLSHTDTLTGLPNRAAFGERAMHALALARRHETKAALLLLDLDGFKEVNETLGHEAGDRLLVDLASRLKTVLRASDTLARFGGDEFLIMAENLPAITGAADLARRVLDLFKDPLIPEDIRHGRTCSIGIAVYPDDAETLDDLLRMADIAMYRAKSSGGNTWRCHTESLECRQEHEKGPV